MTEEIHRDEATDVALVTGYERETSPLVELTAYIRKDQALALEILENAERQRVGGKFDRDDLIRQALDLLIEHRLVAIRLAKHASMKQKTIE